MDKKPIFVREENLNQQKKFLPHNITLKKQQDYQELLNSNKFCGKGKYIPKPFSYYDINGKKCVWWGKGKYPDKLKEIIAYEKQHNPDGVSITELRYILKYCSLKTKYRLISKYTKELIEKYIPYI